MHFAAARSCFPERKCLAFNCSWAVPALQHGLRATVLQTRGLPLRGSRAFPSWACWEQTRSQRAREPTWGSGSFLVQIWFLASSTGSCSDTGWLCWPDWRVRLSLLRTPGTSPNESSHTRSLQIWYQGLQWKAHHSDLPKDLGYHEGLNSGSEVKWFLFFKCQHKINFDNSCKMEEKLFSDFVCQNSSLGPSSLLYFSAKFHNVHWSYTISVPSCYHGDLHNNWNFLY